MNKKDIIFKEIQRLGNSITKKEEIVQEQFNNGILLEYVKKLIVDQKNMPENSPFKNLTQWNNTLEKKENKYRDQLEKLENNAVILEALNKYVTANSETLE